VRETEQRLVWKALNAGITAAFVVVIQHALSAVWSRFEHAPPPEDPADRSVTLSAAVTWSVSTGIGVAVARLIAQRLSARVWEAVEHQAPPVAA
jgi:hypothetical protein